MLDDPAGLWVLDLNGVGAWQDRVAPLEASVYFVVDFLDARLVLGLVDERVVDVLATRGGLDDRTLVEPLRVEPVLAFIAVQVDSADAGLEAGRHCEVTVFELCTPAGNLCDIVGCAVAAVGEEGRGLVVLLDGEDEPAKAVGHIQGRLERSFCH